MHTDNLGSVYYFDRVECKVPQGSSFYQMTKRTKHATLSEVAKKAGVGTTTVSRVINGGQSVDPKTQARVLLAIEGLGYMPSQAARTLKGGRARTIGFVIPSIADPFFSSCAEAAQAVVQAHDSVLIVLTTQNDPKAELDAVNMLMRHRVDGLIIAPCNVEDSALNQMLGRISIPVVTLDRPIEGSSIPSVVSDNFAGAQMATQHLIDHGYRRIVCLTRETHLYTIQERMRGYKETMKAAGLKPLIDTSVEDYASAEKCLLKLLSSSLPPEALFTLKNSTTVAVFEVLQKHGVKVPRKVALLGYDDFQLAEIVRPSISVIRQPIEEMGRAAAELLFKHLLSDGTSAARPSSNRQQVQLTTKLVRRASCGCEATGRR
jgi:LacI family transcriptional regulator